MTYTDNLTSPAGEVLRRVLGSITCDTTDRPTLELRIVEEDVINGAALAAGGPENGDDFGHVGDDGFTGKARR